MKSIKVPLVSDDYYVTVAYGNTKFIGKVLRDAGYKKKYKKVFNEARGVTFHSNGCIHPVIALHKKPKTADDIGLLAHEADHAVNCLFKYLSQKPAEEMHAYFVEAIVRITLQKFKVL